MRLSIHIRVLLLFLVLCCNWNIVSAQRIIYPGDTNSGYFIPRFDTVKYTNCRLGNSRGGNIFPSQKAGSKIYGIATVAPEEYTTDLGAMVCLYKPENGQFHKTDSLIIDSISPTFRIPVTIEFTLNGHEYYIDSLLPVIEAFFDRGYNIDDTCFGLAIGLARPVWGHDATEDIQEGIFMRVKVLRSLNGLLSYKHISESFHDGQISASFFDYDYIFCLFPITDSILWARHQLTKNCGHLTGAAADYTDVRTFTLHWTDTSTHCLYQIAYGDASQPMDSWTVAETHDTLYTLAGLNYGERMAFRVRAQCCYYDTITVWVPWTDTVQFERPYVTLTLHSNNPLWGETYGGGIFEEGALANPQAVAGEGCRFVEWSDGDTSAARIITMDKDSVLTAIFDTTRVDTEDIHIAVKEQAALLPNPTGGHFTVVTTSTMELVTIYDMKGRCVKTVAVNGDEARIDIGDLASGTYTVVITTHSGTQTKRLTKM